MEYLRTCPGRSAFSVVSPSFRSTGCLHDMSFDPYPYQFVSKPASGWEFGLNYTHVNGVLRVCKMSSNSDDELNVLSPLFNPTKALYSKNVKLPDVSAPQLDNITKFELTDDGEIRIKPAKLRVISKIKTCGAIYLCAYFWFFFFVFRYRNLTNTTWHRSNAIWLAVTYYCDTVTVCMYEIGIDVLFQWLAHLKRHLYNGNSRKDEPWRCACRKSASPVGRCLVLRCFATEGSALKFIYDRPHLSEVIVRDLSLLSTNTGI